MARPKSALLTPDKVVAAAIALIGETGLENFSMPKLATALNVSTPSLYHYFADRDALLTAVARTVATPAVPTLPASAHWTEYFVAQAVALRTKVVTHPRCAPLLVQFKSTDNIFGEYEQSCRVLAAAGVPAHLHAWIVDGLTALTIGAAILVENSADYATSGRGPSPDPREFPALRAALDAVEGRSGDQMFESYIRTYLGAVLRQKPSLQPPG